MGDLNDREIASLIWLAIALLWLIWKGQALGLLAGLARTFCKPIILRSVALMATYVAGCVWILAHFKIWAFDNTKTTLVWFGTFVLGWLFNFNRWDGDPDAQARATLKELLSVIAIVTFVTDFYTFPLLGELVFVPVLAFVGMMAAVAGKKAESQLVAKLCQGILMLAGLTMLTWAAAGLIGDFARFATIDNGREFATPALLSLMFLPFMYAFNVYAAYELGFIALPKAIEGAALKGYALRAAIRGFGINVKLMRRWKAALFNRDAATRADIDQLVSTMRSAVRRERNPPAVPAEHGWSPYAAGKWPVAQGIAARDYNPIYGEWGSSSPYRKLDDTILGDNLAYYVRGTEMAATRLTLTLNRDRRKGETSEDALAVFSDAVVAVVSGVFGGDAPRIIRGLKNKRHQTRQKPVTVMLKEDDHRLQLILTHDAHVEPL
ncbi:hypothetical protein ASD38_20640 [Caulobacter sp. Root487D2Y]|uniref:hypothetical protein n=1 Tax=Caulobacter sp. Root487D2Y TaxID=1736547 RepID=UPI0006FE0848|nr:hypothetical protein [Caulobacter sp. Root487D2Y]KQY26154.1 hypothetical protein ASD38_20640 [Caulobacter sp. Root487D2Y]